MLNGDGKREIRESEEKQFFIGVFCKGEETEMTAKEVGSRFAFFFNRGEITACMSAHNNDSEDKRKVMLQEKGGWLLKKCS